MKYSFIQGPRAVFWIAKCFFVTSPSKNKLLSNAPPWPGMCKRIKCSAAPWTGGGVGGGVGGDMLGFGCSIHNNAYMYAHIENKIIKT